MKIITRYILKEHAGPFIFSLSALTSILLLQTIARRLGDLIGRGLSWQVITEFLLLSVPFTVAMSLPMTVLVSVLFVFSRLTSDNEITAFRAGGVSTRTLIMPALIASVFLAIGMLAFNDQVLPRANHRLSTLQQNILRTKPTFALREQVINPVKEGQLYIRASRIDKATSTMRDVVIYDLNDAARRRTIYADSGILALAANRQDLVMHLYNGMVLSVANNQPEQLNRVFYDQQVLKVRDVASQFKMSAVDTATKGDREMSICEMQVELVRASAMLQRAEDYYRDQQRAASGESAKLTKAPEPTPARPVRGIGAMYCSFLDMLLPKELVAQDPRRDPIQPAPQSSASSGEHGVATQQAYELTAAKEQLVMARRSANRYAIEIQKKFSLAAACIVFVLVGAPIALRFPRGGVGLVIAVSFVVFAIYYVELIGGESLANKAIVSPFWAMWGANVVFLIVGLILLLRTGRESSTSRGGGLGEMMDSARMWFTRRGRRDGFDIDRGAQS